MAYFLSGAPIARRNPASSLSAQFLGSCTGDFGSDRIRRTRAYGFFASNSPEQMPSARKAYKDAASRGWTRR
jgi:hypothetical protein